MTDDEELANRVIEAGVGKFKHECYWINYAGFSPYQFVRDWRVAGALIEQRTASQILRIFGEMGARAHPSPFEIIEKIIGWLNED